MHTLFARIFCTQISVLFCLFCYSQNKPIVTCGQKEITEKSFRENPATLKFHQTVEKQLLAFTKARKALNNQQQRINAVPEVLPVVVHIIHNNGSENITDAQAITAIQHLNEAYANTGYYDPAQGVDTRIQFCLAQRDPNGNATTGITRDVSAYTVMGGPGTYTDDQNVKNVNRWNPTCYINIWLVRDIPGNVAGYAYLPSAHGTVLDGIVMEAGFFGSSYANDVVVIHEMGHYLGLYHTFEGACTNNDCTTDGDRVCDTPPDQSTAYTSCNTSTNSCSTDPLSGFGSDVADLTQDYMDYGNFNCMNLFTQGQADRMNWHIQNVRSSLLNCMSCLSPCPAPVTADFTASAGSGITAGTTVIFNNTSVNASSYTWYVNGVVQPATASLSYMFATSGTYEIKLVAHSSSSLCADAVKSVTIHVICTITAAFSHGDTTITPNTTLTFTSSSTGATSYAWFINGAPVGSMSGMLHTFFTKGNYIIKLVVSNGVCSDSISKTVVVQDACDLGTFQRTYGGILNDFAADFQPTADGGYLVAGRTNSFGSVNDDGYLIKADALGDIQWSRTYGGAGADLFTRVISTPDGGYLAIGQTKSYGIAVGAAWFVKTDANGIVQWSRQYGANTTFGEIVNGICITSDGGYAIVGRYDSNPGTVDAIVMKLDANGNLLWNKIFDRGNTDQSTTIMEDNGGLIVTGYTRAATYHDIYMMKLNPTNGNMLWMKKYDLESKNNFVAARMYRQGNNYIFNSHTLNDFTNVNTGRNIVLTTDLDGNVTKILQVEAPDYSLSSSMIVPTADGGFVTQHNEDNTTSDFNMFKISSSGQVEWAKKYPMARQQVNIMLKPSIDGGWLSVGYTNLSGNNDIYVIKTDALGNTPGCNSVKVPVNITTPGYTANTYTWDMIYSANFVNPIIITTQSLEQKTVNNSLCINTTRCDTMHITGRDSVCNLTDTITFKAIRENGCTWPVQWTIDTAFAKTITVTDSTISILFKKTGTVTIYGELTTACKTIKDSINIYIANLQRPVNLGPDRQLCSVSTHVLHAGPGYKSYVWQDGSTDSTLTVFNTGTYHVTAEDYCGNVYKDTIIISQAPVVPFDLGPDLEKCEGDTLTIMAPAGFTNYRWSADYRISSLYTQTVKVSPLIDTVYSVTAESSPGCLVIDTIRITIHKTIPIHLGGDTSFCKSDTITLDAGSGFTNYLWNTGAVTQTIAAYTAGTYYVAAGNNGCKSYDTLVINSIFDPPAVDLGNDTILCLGINKVFNAGNYTSYLWHDGSTRSTFTAVQPGRYWVMVTDGNGCTNSDTVQITGVLDSPADFLADTAHLCRGEDVLIKALNPYKQYQWYNNAITSSILIAAAGKYWLQVTDFNGCTGKDTIEIIAKDCKISISFPNAFSPNNDRSNNTFRPIVYGKLEKFYMVIFNRWGQKIFESHDAGKGWDGTFKGKSQDTNTFVWMSRYKFSGTGQTEKTEKGIITLIR